MPDPRAIEPQPASDSAEPIRGRADRRAIAVFVLALAFAIALFSLAPALDLWASGLFYRAGSGFFLGDWGPVRGIYIAIPYVTRVLAVGVIVLFLLGLWRGRAIWRMDGRAALYLLLALALGPGLLVNAALKDHWGRARPAQVSEFGGAQHFTPALVKADQCARNCSFPAGHPAIGFYLVSFALLVPAPRRRTLAIAAAIAAGAVVGVARMAQGGHFLSDVVFAGFIVCATSWLLHRALVAEDAIGALARALGLTRPPRWLMLSAAAVVIAALLSIAFLDRPVARFFHGGDPALVAVFQFITQFGLGKGYLIGSAFLAAGFSIGAWITRDAALARRLSLSACRALFIFAVVAISGIIADLLKLIFGRARPKLLFADNIYGFTWGAGQSDYWSMPSGHATTIAALAMAFFLLWPRGLPAYAIAALLVIASRVIIGAHYPSDVLVGTALGMAIAGAIWRAFPHFGLALAPPLPEAAVRAQR